MRMTSFILSVIVKMSHFDPFWLCVVPFRVRKWNTLNAKCFCSMHKGNFLKLGQAFCTFLILSLLPFESIWFVAPVPFQSFHVLLHSWRSMKSTLGPSVSHAKAGQWIMAPDVACLMQSSLTVFQFFIFHKILGSVWTQLLGDTKHGVCTYLPASQFQGSAWAKMVPWISSSRLELSASSIVSTNSWTWIIGLMNYSKRHRSTRCFSGVHFLNHARMIFD